MSVSQTGVDTTLVVVDKSGNVVVQPAGSPQVIMGGQTAILSVQPKTMTVIAQQLQQNIVTIGIQGPPGVSEEEMLMDLAIRRDIVEDSPNPGDITVYDGWAMPGTADTDPAWKIARTIYDSANGFDAEKRFADGDNNYDNVWADRLILTYL